MPPTRAVVINTARCGSGFSPVRNCCADDVSGRRGRVTPGAGEHVCAQPRSAQPDQPIAQSVLGWVRAQHCAQSRNERTGRVLSPRKSPLRDENDAVVSSASIHSNPIEQSVMSTLLADDSSALGASDLDYLRV